jgi:hypothetical protein
MEAIANQAFKREDKKLHPMFRRTSTGGSTSTNGMDDEKPEPAPKRRKIGGGVKEEPIELVDSDEDLDGEVKPLANGNGNKSRDVAREVKGAGAAEVTSSET